MDSSGNFRVLMHGNRRRIATAGLILAAAMLGASPVWAEGVTPWDASAKEARSAEVKFKAASKLYDKGEFDKAIELFQESYEIVASPNTSLMIARAYREGGQLRKSMAEFHHAVEVAEAAAEHSEKYKPALDAAKKELADLEATMGHIEVDLVNAPEGTRVVIDGDRVDDIATPVTVQPGTISVVATSPDGRETRQQVEVSAGVTKKVRLGFARAEDPEMFFDKEGEGDEPETAKGKSKSSGSTTRTLAYVTGGVGLVGAAAFGVFGTLSNSKFKDLESACTDNHCPPSRAGDINDGRRFQTIANVGLAVGAVGLATSVVLFIVSPSHKKEKPKPEAAPEISLGLGSVELRGRF